MKIISQLFIQIEDELTYKDSSSEEMIRIHLKQIIIRATLGYDDPTYFNRMFKQKAGHSPAAFRKGIRS
ncbi:hypothetical protein [Parapedobacter tibetensis]|uniref:hypothetical protein n=1 Tax=Parapedobacter tibetensis TaxID=2972951 RepID=UPI00214D639A|nr:hypothetical protein [Parapedobacter tibetensis]